VSTHTIDQTAPAASALDQQGVQQFRAEVIGRKNLPTIPAVLAKIIGLTDGENASGKDLVEVVEHDQSLTSKILRLANSAFFGQSRQVATIPRAVVLLGFSTVRNLALSVKVWEALGNGVSKAHLEELWGHSVAVAVATKHLTARLRAGDPDEAFTSGLLHDVGRLVIAMRFKEHYWQAVGGAAERGPVETVESATFGVDHAEVGGWMLEAWNLPPGIVEAVRLHHTGFARRGVPGTLAVANRLITLSDLATGVLEPEATPFLEMVAERGVTAELWTQTMAALQAGGALAMAGANG
jgi:putative nucleotidyltransferase with HDIG domain